MNVNFIFCPVVYIFYIFLYILPTSPGFCGGMKTAEREEKHLDQRHELTIISIRKLRHMRESNPGLGDNLRGGRSYNHILSA